MGAEQHSVKYRRIIRAVMSIPWAILPQRLCDIIDVLSFQSAGGKLSPAEVAEYIGHGPEAADGASAASRPMSTSTGRSLAILPIRGIIAQHMDQVTSISGPGGTSIEGLTQDFRAAMSDPNVAGVLFDIDSPGGSVYGVPELAAEIFAARGTKPIRAVANSLAASAAYWIGTAADEITVTPSGEVGSIGVFSAHSDLSARLEAEGEKITLVHAGRYKVEGNPFEPLGDDARDAMQGRVDDVYRSFVEAVAEARDVPVKTVSGGFGEGRVVGASQALELGMVDAIETQDSALARLREDVKGGASSPRARGSAMPQSAAEFAFIGR